MVRLAAQHLKYRCTMKHLAAMPLDLSRPRVMAILNITPDSFSDGGLYLKRDQALFRAQQMVAEGADIIDIGGESTRPGAAPVSVEEELDRVIPVIEALHAEFPLPLSIDTSKPAVMAAAINAGAAMVNDVRALQTDGALAAVAASKVMVCLMHMQGEPQTMQANPYYQNIIQELKQFFYDRIAACAAAGISKERIIIDPGYGFGKTVEHNLILIRELAAFKAIGLPILLGVSRKSSIGKILNATPEQRLYGSLALTVLAVNNGANIIRTHDVKPTVDALLLTQAVMNVK